MNRIIRLPLATDFVDTEGTLADGQIKRVSGATKLTGGVLSDIRGNRENLVLYSEDFSQWTASEITLDASQADPRGGTDATGLVASVVAGAHYLTINPTFIDNADVTVSMFLKAGAHAWLQIQLNLKDGTTVACYFHLSGDGATGVNTTTKESIERLGTTDWYRCSITHNIATGANSPLIAIFLAEANNDRIFSGDGTTIDTYVYGAQAEELEGPPASTGLELITKTTNRDFSSINNWAKGTMNYFNSTDNLTLDTAYLEDETGYTDMRGSFVDGQAWFDGEVITNLDSSDFSAGVDGYSALNDHTFNGNHDAVSDGTISKDNCLMLAANDANLSHYAQIAKAINGMSDQADFKVTYSFYVPAAQTHADGLRVSFHSGTAEIVLATHEGINGTWVTNTVYYSEPETGTMSLLFRQMDGAVYSFTGDNDGTGDLLYLHNIVIDSYVSLSTQFAPSGAPLTVDDGGGNEATGFIGEAPVEETLGANQVTNDEFTVDLTGWSQVNYTQTRVDSGVDPGATSPGSDNWCLKGVATAPSARAHIYTTSTVIGKLYKVSLRYYVPAGDPNIYVTLGSADNIITLVATKDAWQFVSAYVIAMDTNAVFYIGNGSAGGAIGDILYIDSIGVEEVTQPNASAVTIYKETELSNEGWNTIDAGFDYNAGPDFNFLVGYEGTDQYCTLPISASPMTSYKGYQFAYDMEYTTGGTWTLKDFDGGYTLGTITSGSEYVTFAYDDASNGGIRLVADGDGARLRLDNVSLKEIGQPGPSEPGVYTATDGSTETIPAEAKFEDDWLTLEHEAVNVLPYSEDFGQWVNSQLTLDTNKIDPRGEIGATGLISSVVDGEHSINFVLTVADNADVTYTLFVKAGVRERVCLMFANKNGGYPYAYFQLTGAGIIGSHITTKESIERLGTTDWYKLRITHNTGTGATTPRVYVFLAVGDNDKSFQGDGSTIDTYIYGAQVEETPFATSYIPTNGSPAIRTTEAGSALDNGVSWPIPQALKNILSDAEPVGSPTDSQGTLLFDVKWGCDESDIAVGNYYGLISPRDAIYFLAYFNSIHYYLKDGTNTTVIGHPAFSAGDIIYYASRWGDVDGNVNDMSVGLRESGDSWCFSTASNYDGAFTLGTDLRLAFSNIYPIKIRNIEFWDGPFARYKTTLSGGGSTLDYTLVDTTSGGYFNAVNASAADTFNNCTVIAPYGVALVASEDVTLSNTILKGNDKDIDIASAKTVTGKNNLLPHHASATDNEGDGTFTDTDSIFNQDPGFVSDSDFNLKVSSPAINKGDNAVWSGTPNITDANGLDITDSTGLIVAPGGTVDVGAYEYGEEPAGITPLKYGPYGTPIQGGSDITVKNISLTSSTWTPLTLGIDTCKQFITKTRSGNDFKLSTDQSEYVTVSGLYREMVAGSGVLFYAQSIAATDTLEFLYVK